MLRLLALFSCVPVWPGVLADCYLCKQQITAVVILHIGVSSHRTILTTEMMLFSLYLWFFLACVIEFLDSLGYVRLDQFPLFSIFFPSVRFQVTTYILCRMTVLQICYWRLSNLICIMSNPILSLGYQICM